jgi:hypothetical protein
LVTHSGHQDRSADDLAGVHVGVGLLTVLDRVRRGLACRARQRRPSATVSSAPTGFHPPA